MRCIFLLIAFNKKSKQNFYSDNYFATYRNTGRNNFNKEKHALFECK